MKKVKPEAIETRPQYAKSLVSLKRQVPILLGLSAISVAAVCLSFNQRAEATIISDWEGRWNCNLDGRPAVLTLELVETHIHHTSPPIVQTSITGQISDNGGPWMPIYERGFDSGDLASSWRDHMLPLLYNGTDKWMLIMHTWNHRYASGYTTWSGIPFGLQCRRA